MENKLVTVIGDIHILSKTCEDDDIPPSELGITISGLSGLYGVVLTAVAVGTEESAYIVSARDDDEASPASMVDLGCDKSQE